MNKFKTLAIVFVIASIFTYSIFSPDSKSTVYLNDYAVSSSAISSASSMFVSASTEFGVPASVLMALAIHETSFGTAGVGKSRNNWFGISKSSIYPTPAGCTGSFECYTSSEDSIRDAARLLGSPNSYYKITNILIQNGGLSGSYEAVTKSITAHWCTSGCTYDYQTLLDTIEAYNLKQYDTELSNMSVSDLKALLEKYYGQDATIIPGYDKDTGTWDGNYDTPDLSDNNYDGIYLNTSYSGDITKGYIYQKYSDMSLWDEMALDTDESKVIHVIQNIFLQGEKLYGDEKLHLSDFQFNGSDYDAPITTGDGDTISTGSPLSCYTAITSSFNNQESFRTATHKGLDIAAPAGTKIYSVVDGVVVASNSGCPAVGYYGNKCGGGYGNYVKVKASDGKFYIYAHMYQTPLVSTGDSVSKGQQLGIVGSSGSSTGNHLHFEVRNSGNTAINPIDYANTGSIPKC